MTARVGWNGGPWTWLREVAAVDWMRAGISGVHSSAPAGRIGGQDPVREASGPDSRLSQAVGFVAELGCVTTQEFLDTPVLLAGPGIRHR